MTLSRRFRQVETFLEEKAEIYPAVFTENLFRYLESLQYEEKERALFSILYKNSPVTYKDYQKAKFSPDHEWYNMKAAKDVTAICLLSGAVVEWIHDYFQDKNQILSVISFFYKDMGISEDQELYIADVLAGIYEEK